MIYQVQFRCNKNGVMYFYHYTKWLPARWKDFTPDRWSMYKIRIVE